jgi:hypothetical protein
MSNELATQDNKSMSVFDSDQFAHWMNVAQKLASSDMVPKNYKGKPMDILVAIDMGRSVGLPMMQSLQSIAVINGMPSMYSDAPLAVCQSHPSFEWIKEEALMIGKEIDGYKCTVKRRNNDEHVVIFTVADAKKASLWGKQGPWSQYPSRMLQMRARGFALRNTFPDALRGIQIAEEVQDIQTIEGTWTPKQSQSDKMQSLLTKKGLNNASKNMDKESNMHDSNASYTVDDDGVLHSNSDIELSNNQSSSREKLAEAGESQNISSDKTNVSGKCTKEQLESIEFKMELAGFDDKRRLKALKHFDVCTFPELSFDQAEELIKMIERA